MENKAVKSFNKWFIFPDLLKKARFFGFRTSDDITQMRGGFPIGQNVEFTESMTPTVRPGSELIGVAVDSAYKVRRAWVFERRDGIEIEMKCYGTGVYFLINGVMSDYELLEGGFTADKEFGYGVISESGDVNSRVNYCNGVDDWRKWTGLYAEYASDDGVNVITISGAVDVADLGFTATGTLRYKGTAITYTGISGKTFTGCSTVPSVIGGEAVGDIIVDSPIVMTAANVLKSSVCAVHDGRIHARNEAKKSVSLYSKLDNPDDWTTGSSDGDGGAKEIEQGGPITAYAQDEEKLYIFKNRLIKTLQFVANTSRIDVPKYGTLKPSNDKSTTIGARGQKSTFTSPNGIIFVTLDNQLIHLTRQATIDYPQQIDLADSIRPTFSVGVHDEAAGIVYKSKVFYSYKQDSNSNFNDVVVVYDLIRGLWSAPYIGWNVSDWTIVDNKLRWHSSTSPDTFELTDDKLDNGQSFTTILRSWQENFGYAHQQKKISYAYIEIYMDEISEITASILYDEDGASGQEDFILKGTDSDNKVGVDNYNPFGASPFGSERFGSNADLSGMRRYRYILELKNNTEFFDVALQLTTDKEAINYELVRFGYKLSELYPLEPIKLVKGPTEPDNLNFND